MIKITGTRSYIDVEFDDKTVRIEGELTMIPSFYASIDSIQYWKTTTGMVKINKEERDWIVSEIINHNNQQFEIIFEE